MCLLIIGLVVTGCGSASNNNGSLNNPVISSVTPDGRNTSVASSTVVDGIRITLKGANFGSGGWIWYNPASSTDPNSSLEPVRMSSNVGNVINWSDTQIDFTLLNTTRAIYPSGTFTVENNNGSRYTSYLCEFNGGDLTKATITGISPSVFYSYDNNSNRYVTVSGNGFGTEKKNLTLFSMSGSYCENSNISPLYWSNESITFMLPDNLVNTTSNIGIKVTETGNMLGSNSYQYPIKYVVFNPTISYISPNKAYLGQEVTISSNNGGFGESRPAGANIMVGGISVNNITSWTDYEIRFVIPENAMLSDGQTNVALNCNNKSVAGSIILIPHISNVTVSKDSGILSSTYYYTVTGSCFSNNTTMYITNNPSVTVVSHNSNSIIFSSTTDLGGRTITLMGSDSSSSNMFALPYASTN